MAKWFTFKNKRHIPGWLAKVLAGVLRLYAWTFRVRYEDPYGIMDRMQTEAQVFGFWHNRILFAAPVIPFRCRAKATVLVSASRDGEYITTLLRCFGMEAVRGSSSRGGGQALERQPVRGVRGRGQLRHVGRGAHRVHVEDSAGQDARDRHRPRAPPQEAFPGHAGHHLGRRGRRRQSR